jgi:hypothetical protein
MSLIIKNKITENLNEVSLKTEVLDYELPCLVGAEYCSKKFDFVVRNKNKEIVFVCNVYNGDLDGILKNLTNKLEVQSGFPYCYIIISKMDLKAFFFNERYNSIDNPIVDFELFIKKVKQLDRNLMKEIDYVLEELNDKKNEINELRSLYNSSEKKNKDEISFLNSIRTDNHKKIDDLEKDKISLIKCIEADLKFRLIEKNSELNFINYVDSIPIPQSNTTSKDVRFGFGSSDFVKVDIVNTNSTYDISFTILKEQIYLRIQFYDYYNEGPIGLASFELSHTNYYLFNSNEFKYESVDKDGKCFLGWVFRSDLKKEI